jgi:hypothetical protein
LWCSDGHVYIVGLAGRAVWLAIPSKGLLTEVLELDRLDLRGSHDPEGCIASSFTSWLTVTC